MSTSLTPEQLHQLIARVNDEAIGRSCDDLEFRASPKAASVDVYFRYHGQWVARVPDDCVELGILEALAAAVRIGRALGRAEGKREIGDFLRQECGL